jgi:hypothetical protein
LVVRSFEIRSMTGRVLAAVPLAALILLGGCVNVGPKAVQAVRADYNTVLRDTTDEQLLANLVRLRYRDRPFFLEVSAVTTQYSFSPQLSASAAIGPSNIEQEAIAGGSVGYAEQPTISYVPLQGDEFARRLLTPLSLEALLLLGNSGWSIDRLLRLCVQRINGLPNAATASGPTPDVAPEYRRFHRLSRRLRELQLSGDGLLGYVQDGGTTYPILVFSERARTGDAYAELIELLGVAPGQPHYRLSLALEGASSNGINIQTRSLNGVLYYLSQAVTVPDTHIRQGLVTQTRGEAGDSFSWSEIMSDLFSIRVSSNAPDSAAVRIPYRGHWFYIADADLSSKSTFSLLAQLFALQAGSGEQLRPMLTIPVGG